MSDTFYKRLRSLIPRPMTRYVKHFEAVAEDAVAEFANALGAGASVLDAGAGEGQYKRFFKTHRYCGFDLAVGDKTWDYRDLDVRGDLAAMPFRDASFDAAINVVTLEHVREPARVVCELGRVLKPGGCLLLVAPHEWEEHQQPHDYYRYTRYGLEYLLRQAGFSEIALRPVGGIFRLLSRRLWAAMQFLPVPLDLLFLMVIALPALLLPMLDSFDTRQNFTLGYICVARK